MKVCAGKEAGCKSLLHAIHTIYQIQLSEAVLLVDTSNAFNSINKNVFLHNIGTTCHPLARCDQNCYYGNTTLFIIGEWGKFNQWRGQHRVILQQLQYTQSPLYHSDSC